MLPVPTVGVQQRHGVSGAVNSRDTGHEGRDEGVGGVLEVRPADLRELRGLREHVQRLRAAEPGRLEVA